MDLLSYDKLSCLALLKSLDLNQLWDQFLRVQTELYFPQEAECIGKESFWEKAKTVLDLGSGNGEYIHRVSEKFPDKVYVCIEKQHHFVTQANQNFGSNRLFFREGDLESNSFHIKETFDVIILRLALQHLKEPRALLEKVAPLLAPNGHIIIIESFDQLRSMSIRIPTLESANAEHNALNLKEGKGNRKISAEILHEIESKGPLSELYSIHSSNFNEAGTILFKKAAERERYFSHLLYYLTILSKGRNIEIDFSKAYDELQTFVHDENAWSKPGMHYLFLSKNSE